MTDEIETIEEWAARVAPMQSADEWRLAERLAAGERPGCCGERSAEQSRALLAYRDKVAAGLTEAMRAVLRRLDEDDNEMFLRDNASAVLALHDAKMAQRGVVLSARGLSDRWQSTPFGREVARVLEARP